MPETPRNNPEEPADFLKEKYWDRPDFRQSVERSAQSEQARARSEGEEIPVPVKPQEKIPLYLNRLERIAEKKGELFKKEAIYPKYIIKPEDISSDYFKNILLGNFAEQVLGYEQPDMQVQEIRERAIRQFEQQTGKKFDSYQIPEDEHKKLVAQIQQDQKTRIDLWFSYLTSPEAKNYPEAFRYWAFAEMLKLGSYDKTRKDFNRRTEQTASPFAELNQQALAMVFDEVKKNNRGESSGLADLDPSQQKDFSARLQSENFGKLYGFCLEHVNSLYFSPEALKETEGEWRTFKKGSDPKDLSGALSSFSTQWCIAAEGTAQSYLNHSDVLVYFSKDKEGNNVVPRAALVTDGQKISEVRGVLNDKNSKQYLDSQIAPVVEQKLKTMQGGKEWLLKVGDVKQLARVHLKHLKNQDLTQADLKFVYEIDHKIANTGFGTDPRLAEILARRDKRQDLSHIFGYRPEQISLTEGEALRGDIEFHFGDLDLGHLTSAEGLKLPESIGGTLYLGGLTSAEGLKLPKSVGRRLYLGGLTSAEGLKLPKSIGGTLVLNGLTSAEGLKLPKSVGSDLYLGGLTSAEGLKLPKSVGRRLYLSGLTSAEDLKLPESVDSLYLGGLTSAEGLELPKSIGGTLVLNGLTSAEGLKLPKSVGSDLDLGGLTSAEGLELPKSVGRRLYLDGLTSAEGLKLPESIGGGLYLNSLTSAEGLKLPESIGGNLDLESLAANERGSLREKRPDLNIYP